MQSTTSKELLPTEARGTPLDEPDAALDIDTTETVRRLLDRMHTAMPQVATRRAWERDGKDTVQKLRQLYDKRVALMGRIYESLEHCRAHVQDVHRLHSEIDCLDGNLAEINSFLDDEADQPPCASCNAASSDGA